MFRKAVVREEAVQAEVACRKGFLIAVLRRRAMAGRAGATWCTLAIRLLQTSDHGPWGVSFQCPTNCPAGVKGPPGLQGVKVSISSPPGVRGEGAGGGAGPHWTSPSPSRGTQANVALWETLATRGSR